MSSPSRLVRATDARAFERDAVSHLEWGGGLSVADHQRREQRLRETPWARASWDPWFWEEDGRVLSSCETYRTPLDGGTAWLLASVLTAPELRGRGHASRMLRALTERLAGEPGARAIVLFSDVDPAIYARLGWVALPALDRTLPPSGGDPDGGPWRRLADPPVGAPGVGLRPTADQLRWQVARAHTLADATGRTRLATSGAETGAGAIAWTEEGGELLVLRRDDDPLLLEAAARTAGERGLRAVRAWDTGAPWPSGEPEPRRGAVPMVLALGGPVDVGPVCRGSWV